MKIDDIIESTKPDHQLTLEEKLLAEWGRVVKGVNTTDDVDVDAIKKQAKKMGFDVDIGGVPPLLRPSGKSKVNESVVTEARRDSVILVDFQPAYQSDDWGYDEAIESAIEYINAKQPQVIAFFNGEDVGIEDTSQEVLWHYIEHGLNEELVDLFTMREKSYAWLRNWMDQGVDASVIIAVVRYMVLNGVNDSREIDEETMMQIVGEDNFSDTLMSDDMIYIPDISIAELKELSGSLLGGGGKHECLKELQLLMNAFNIRYKEVSSWIYG